MRRSLPLRLVGIFLVAGGVVIAATLVVQREGSEFKRVRVDAVPPPSRRDPAEREGTTRLVADASGIGIADFGAEAEPLERRLTELLGAPDERIARPCEERADVRWRRWGNLTLVFDRNEFLAYLLTAYPGPKADRRVAMPTPEGLRLGDSIERLRELYGPVSFSRPPDFPPNAKGREFRLPTKEGMFWGGGVDELGAGGRVVAIAAGQQCGS